MYIARLRELAMLSANLFDFLEDIDITDHLYPQMRLPPRSSLLRLRPGYSAQAHKVPITWFSVYPRAPPNPQADAYRHCILSQSV
jgi:hypothetical protein